MTAAGTAGTVSVLHCRAANAAAATSWSQQLVRLKRVETAELCCRSSTHCHGQCCNHCSLRTPGQTAQMSAGSDPSVTDCDAFLALISKLVTAHVSCKWSRHCMRISCGPQQLGGLFMRFNFWQCGCASDALLLILIRPVSDRQLQVPSPIRRPLKLWFCQQLCRSKV